jgi:hypothetical protein
MAISIDWGNQIILVPKSYLTHIAGLLYELDTNQFRLDLKALEASEAGMCHLDTHDHNTTYVVSGVTYARKLEIINGYEVTFEDGQYRVRLAGSNNNILDVATVNQVGIAPQNSAGLVVAPDITAASVAVAVLEELIADHITTSGSLGEAIAIIAGARLYHVLDGGPGQATVQLDSEALMITGRLRIFASNAQVAAATMGAADGADNELRAVTFTTTAAEAGRIDNMRVA